MNASAHEYLYSYQYLPASHAHALRSLSLSYASFEIFIFSCSHSLSDDLTSNSRLGLSDASIASIHLNALPPNMSLCCVLP